MKNFLSVLLVLLYYFSQAQIKYHFDYALVYKNSSALKESLYFVNSKDNSYALYTQKNKDSVNTNINFMDFRGLTVNSLVDKTLFFQAETFNNDCSSVHKFSMDLFNRKAKEFEILKHNDTLINDTLYFHYSTKSLKKLRYQKRKKLNKVHFIIDKNSADFKLFIYNPTIYMHLRNTFKLPNGLLKMMYYQNLDGTITFKRELLQTIKLDKLLIIPEDCEAVKSLK
jgi:hypothetical protein